eukprot:scaffold8740_cov113-Cylindrotheca_fusiformis.AAC.12
MSKSSSSLPALIHASHLATQQKWVVEWKRLFPSQGVAFAPYLILGHPWSFPLVKFNHDHSQWGLQNRP